MVKQNDDTFKIARVVNISYASETVMVMYLDSTFNDLYLDSVSLLNCKLYENRKII